MGDSEPTQGDRISTQDDRISTPEIRKTTPDDRKTNPDDCKTTPVDRKTTSDDRETQSMPSTFPMPASQGTQEDDLESELLCTVCFELFYAPVVTPCGHAFCRRCLISCLDRSGNTCPLCRAVCHIDAYAHPECTVLTNVIRKTLPEKFLARTEQALQEDELSAVRTHFPLFVSNLVQFPGASLSLHLFEPRYLKMVKESLEGSRTFGVVHGRPDGTVDEIGTSVQIQAVQVAPMGRYNLTVVGRKRFKVLHLWQDEDSFGLWRATIDAFEDEPQDEVHEQESAGRGLNNNSNNITTGADPRPAGAGSGEEDEAVASLSEGVDDGAEVAQSRSTAELLTVLQTMWDAFVLARPASFRELTMSRYGPVPPRTVTCASQWSLWLTMALPLSNADKQTCLALNSTHGRLMVLLAAIQRFNSQEAQGESYQRVWRHVWFASPAKMLLFAIICGFVAQQLQLPLPVWAMSFANSVPFASSFADLKFTLGLMHTWLHNQTGNQIANFYGRFAEIGEVV
mmetsp:Transcript_4602/g.7800  ORF Transcript_4602/g.7800 Transcript_4602/m.7800 type:complete len:512 (-) Transcript_4602:339-1874(-)|eukprot:CAMPEP_0198198126 /NCGR_PEP_ID=MMETSP1445-20131203/1611_1 /TAXON_ID=36898 /ORGANISM="Pyramimonas sp., Strain CCMP2087" /LENGTH=511 /DNA_ID=CAMNT_0043867591 /DNA_START=730 /DNA_END=2265 /DNA_ORIENTATION=+